MRLLTDGPESGRWPAVGRSVVAKPGNAAPSARHGNRIDPLLPWREMSMAGSDITVEILKDIRDEIRGVRTEVHDLRSDSNKRFSSVETALLDLRTDTNKRSGVVETALLDLAEQHRFVVRYTKAIAERDA